MLFKVKSNAWFFKNIGIIKAERYTNDYSYLDTAKDFLNKEGLLAIYPEARLPRSDEKEGIPFTHGATYLSLDTNSPLLPIYLKESKNFKKRTRLVIGLPFFAKDYYDDNLSREENVCHITEILRERVFRLREVIDGENEKTKTKKA